MASVLAGCALAVGAAMGTSPGLAEGGVTEAMQAERGLGLAQIWCSQCHLVEPEQTGAARTEAPAFEEIANRAEQSAERLERFLLFPHPPMPDLALSRAQMRELALYVMSLKKAEEGG